MRPLGQCLERSCCRSLDQMSAVMLFNGLILPVLDGHPVKRVHSLTEVTNGKGSKLGYITQTTFTAVQN